MKAIPLTVAISIVLAPPLLAKTGPASKVGGQKADWSQTLARATQINSERHYSTLYEACEGSNFPALAQALSAARDYVAPNKNEYWTDAEFEELKSHAESSLNSVGPIVVCQPLDDKDVSFVYDTNREAFVGKFGPRQNIGREYRRTGSYIGRTAMGEQTRVTTGSEVEYNVDLLDRGSVASDSACREYGKDPGCHITYVDRIDAGPNACLHGLQDKCSFEVPVPRAEAPAVKANGYLVFVGRLQYPFIIGVPLYDEPTFLHPTDVTKIMLIVDFTPEEIAVVAPSGTKWTHKVPQP